MPFRKPILALAPNGAVTELVEGGHLGLVVAPDDRPRIEHALCDLYENRHRLAERFPANEAFLRRFEGNVVAQQLQHIIERL